MHDPDPKLVAESKALKLGRKKRVQTIAGQRVEIYLEDDEMIDTNVYEGEEDYENDDEEHPEMEEIYVEEAEDDGDDDDGGGQVEYVMMDVVNDGDVKHGSMPIEELLFDESKFNRTHNILYISLNLC